MTTPMTTETETIEKPALPFTIDEEAFSIWLKNLNVENKLATLQILSNTLTILKQIDIHTDIRSFFLERISTLVFQFSEQLQQTYIKSFFPFSADDNLKVELSIDCSMELAENYALICKDPSFKTTAIFSPQQKALILFNGIQAMTNVHLYKALIYQKPGKGFWSLCFLFYLFAKQNEVLELVPEHQDSCFIKLFKTLLVFELSNSQQFNSKEIHDVFNLLNTVPGHIDLVPMVPGKTVNSVASINLRGDAPPAVNKEMIDEASPYLFYVSCLNLIQRLFELTARNRNTTYSNKVIVLRLIKALSLNQHRQTERELSDNEFFAEIGFDTFNEFLLYKESILKTKGAISYEVRDLSLDEHFNEDTHDDRFGFRNEMDVGLSLQKGPDGEKVEYIDSTDIWAEEEKGPEPNIKIIDQSRLGFFLHLNDENAATKVGDTIHLKMMPTSVLTVVRRIISNNKNEVAIGVEILGYDPELLHIMDIENDGAKTACILRNVDGEESIIIKADEFKNQEFIVADRNDKIIRYRVEKILNSSTATIKHLKVSLS